MQQTYQTKPCKQLIAVSQLSTSRPSSKRMRESNRSLDLDTSKDWKPKASDMPWNLAASVSLPNEVASLPKNSLLCLHNKIIRFGELIKSPEGEKQLGTK